VRAAAVAALFALALIATATLGFTTQPGLSSPAVAACGKERWDVKTLKDTAADSVSLAPQNTTIEKLRKLKVPAGLTQDSPRFIPQETKTYRVKALLMSVKREEDGDLHLVIADPRVGGSMIVEFPASDCLGTRAHDRIVGARQALKEACGDLPDTVGALWTLTGKATLTGVAYFDPIHGQGGVAQNGIELHPVLAVTSTDCTVIHH
jgi:hypothetical protein